MKEKDTSDMTPEEAAEYALQKAEYARKRAERSDKFQTFVLIFCAVCSVLKIAIQIIVNYC